MGFRIGTGYKASSNLQTSSENQEVIPAKPEGWNMGYNFYKFSFQNDQDCHVIINKSGEQLFLRADQGVSIDQVDAPITSFVIVESGITFNWFGAY